MSILNLELKSFINYVSIGYEFDKRKQAENNAMVLTVLDE
ncbi:hypothetical protein VOA_002211 [Vibrio sp. RC586]|nr:hypothetical protein VOA_002211 [Vibrio sp. RC586]